MPGSGRPRPGQIEEAVPMNPWSAAAQQLRRTLQAELLHFCGAEARYANFGNPHRERRHSLNLSQLVGPFVNTPVVPVEGKAMHRDYIHVAQHAESPHAVD